MTLAPGTKLGPYEILSPLGAGGMGEVWKARDARLDRFVAIKVLPEHLTSNADALARFEREAKAVAALNHPNITALHDIGREGTTAFAVMELLEGESLRARLAQGPLTPRKAVDLAVQMAQGLAAAHEKGLIHRDLKPENLWITKDERLKILDFGLAKQGSPMASGPGSNSLLPTEALASARAGLTQEGMILGTVGYMSPEQVRGEPVDARSDLFSFGVVLYEMLTGRKAFARDTTADTLAAILKEDPPDLEAASGRSIPAGLHRLLGHCLDKHPALRFASAHDLAFALESALSAASSGASGLPAVQGASAPRRAWLAAGLLAVPLLLAGGWMLRGRDAQPTFKRLTFGKGTVDGARFMPGSREILFSARWNGAPPEIFSLQPQATEPRALQIKGASLLSVSPSGELAVRLAPRLWSGLAIGTLARITPGGGARPVVQEGVDADWMPGGGDLAEIHIIGRGRDASSFVALTFPPGRSTPGPSLYQWALRVSPDGNRAAFFDQPRTSRGDGRVRLVDREGNLRTLAELKGFTGLAWGPGGREVWVSQVEEGSTSLWAFTPKGRRRLLLRQAGLLELLDVAPDGRALASLGLVLTGTMGLEPPDYREQDRTWNEAGSTLDLSGDGRMAIVGNDLWETTNAAHPLYLRTGTSAPTRLGDGVVATLTPGASHLAVLQDQQGTRIHLLPTGMGSPEVVEVRGPTALTTLDVFPDGQRFLSQTGDGTFQVIRRSDGSAQLLAVDGQPSKGFSKFLGDHPISPDGAWVILSDVRQRTLDAPKLLVPVKGGPSVPVKGLEPGDVQLRWTADGKGIFVFNRDGLPARIHRLDLATGKRTLVREIMPTNPAGLAGIRTLAMTADARVFAYNYVRKLSDLYLIEGLK